MAYFERVGDAAYRATEQVGGAWDTATQHIAPALGLLVHVVERERRTNELVVGRLSYDILGTIPIDVVEIDVRVVRPGRTVELVEAVLGHGGRSAVLLRAWLMRPGDTSALRGTAYPGITPAEDMPAWDPSSVWPGGFIASAEVRREQVEPGRTAFWVRTPVRLIDTEDVSPLARAAGLFDIANGMTVRADPKEVAFPNVDLTAHLFGKPSGDWLGFDTTVTFGGTGIGLTSSVLHDATGPIGTLAQILTLRPT